LSPQPQKNFALLAEQKPEIESMIWQDDRLAVLLRESGIFKSTGQAYNVRGVQWFTFALIALVGSSIVIGKEQQLRRGGNP